MAGQIEVRGGKVGAACALSSACRCVRVSGAKSLQGPFPEEAPWKAPGWEPSARMSPLRGCYDVLRLWAGLVAGLAVCLGLLRAQRDSASFCIIDVTVEVAS